MLKERKSHKLKPIKGEVRRKPKIGEIVIIKEENQPRAKWKVGRIQRLISSDIDEKHRAAQILLSSGLLIKRPFKLIYPVDIDEDDEDENF